MKTDIEIAQESSLLPIAKVAESVGLSEELLEVYGQTKAKIKTNKLSSLPKKGKLILVTAINPTPAGEGKTTTSVGLSDGLNRIGKKTILCLREPSLGPVFGIKGGAAGGGYAQVVPMEDINLHFTGDFHAIGAANNLLAALIDNHIKQGNLLAIDCRRITWRRCVDMNDRQLRSIVDGIGGPSNGMPREDGFDITVASEIMAVFCLARNLEDLKERLARMLVAYTVYQEPVTAADLKAQGALTALLKDAFKPNLVQTLEHNPAFVHGGPFANIAHGCNSLIATETALRLADYTVTEAGFGADLGAEKFCDIKCRAGGLKPDAVVIVTTVRALKYNGGAAKEKLSEKNTEAVERGLPNLVQHLNNMKQVFGLPCVVAVNVFPSDTEEELQTIKNCCQEQRVKMALSEAWAKGSAGALNLAREVVELCEGQGGQFKYAYGLEKGIREKLNAIATKLYHAEGVDLSSQAQKQLDLLTKQGFDKLPICIAKTQYSFSDDPAALGAPRGFRIAITNLKVSAGAGFIVALTGNIMTMPGLPKVPAAERIDVSSDGVITGLF